MEQHEWSRIFQLKAKNLKQGDSWRLEFDEKLVPGCPNSGWEQHSRNIFGRFKCTDCGKAWPSSQAMVVFHMRLTDGQGVVKVRPCSQTCRNCSTKAKPCISSQNINILLESLMEMIRVKCYQEDLGEGNKPSTRSLTTDKKRQLRSFARSLNVSPYLLLLELGEWD